jgi:hypothetical protein
LAWSQVSNETRYEVDPGQRVPGGEERGGTEDRVGLLKQGE